VRRTADFSPIRREPILQVDAACQKIHAVLGGVISMSCITRVVQCILEPYDLAARSADNRACDRRVQQWIKSI